PPSASCALGRCRRSSSDAPRSRSCSATRAKRQTSSARSRSSRRRRYGSRSARRSDSNAGARRKAMTLTDLAGLDVSTTSSDALAAYERGVDLFLRWRGGAPEALEAAGKSDPRFPLAACTRAYIAWRMGRVDLASVAAQQAVERADDAHHERERLHVRAVDALRSGDPATAYQLLERITAEHPTDR